MQCKPKSLKIAEKLSERLEGANYHSLVGKPEKIHELLSEWLGEKALIQVMRALERILYV